MGGSYRRYLSDKIMSVFPNQLIQHTPNTLTVTQTAAVVLGTLRHLRLLPFIYEWCCAVLCCVVLCCVVLCCVVLCCVVLLADTACFLISDPDILTHPQNMLSQYKQPVAPH